MKHIIGLFLSAWVIFLSSSASMAADLMAAPRPHALSGTAAASTTLTEGEIKRIDKEMGKLTIKHNELTHLDMPAMTMVFQVKNLSMLDQVKIGDRISFIADSIDGKLAITALELKK